MGKIKHIIWDWNGTLLDDIDVSMEALNLILRKEALPEVLDKDEYRRYFQFPVIQYYQKVGFDFEKTPFPVLAQAYMDYYQPHSLYCHLHEYAEETLQSLQMRNIHQYLLSASDINFLKEQLSVYDIASYFDDIQGLDNIHANSKADLAKQFVINHSLPKDEVVFIGDSVHDFEVASNAGCESILIANGHEHIDKLKATHAMIFHNMRECKAYLIDIIDKN